MNGTMFSHNEHVYIFLIYKHGVLIKTMRLSHIPVYSLHNVYVLVNK